MPNWVRCGKLSKADHGNSRLICDAPGCCRSSACCCRLCCSPRPHQRRTGRSRRPRPSSPTCRPPQIPADVPVSTETKSLLQGAINDLFSAFSYSNGDQQKITQTPKPQPGVQPHPDLCHQLAPARPRLLHSFITGGERAQGGCIFELLCQPQPDVILTRKCCCCSVLRSQQPCSARPSHGHHLQRHSVRHQQPHEHGAEPHQALRPLHLQQDLHRLPGIAALQDFSRTCMSCPKLCICPQPSMTNQSNPGVAGRHMFS